MSAATAELDAARQALWDVYRILGFDTDGDATPASVPDVERLVVEAAKEMRAESDADYTALSDDLAAALRRLEAAEQSLSSLRAELDRMRTFVGKIAALGVCEDNDEKDCISASGPYCQAHPNWIDDEIAEARKLLGGGSQ